MEPAGDARRRRSRPGDLQPRGHHLDGHVRPRAAPSRSSGGGSRSGPAPAPCSWPSTTARCAASGRCRRGRRPAYATTVEDSVYVHRDHRGQGVGRALLTELVATATAHGFHACMARIVGGGTRRRSRSTSGAASRWWAPSGRWAASSAVARRRAHGEAADMTAGPVDTFPRQQARTQRFTLGAPRDVTVAPDGSPGRLPASGGPRTRSPSLWVSTSRRATSAPWPIPRILLAGDATDLPPEERARASGHGRARRGITGLRHRRRPPHRWRRRWPASSWWPTSSRAPRRSCRCRPR